MLDKEDPKCMDLVLFESFKDTNPRLHAIHHPRSELNE